MITKTEKQVAAVLLTLAALALILFFTVDVKTVKAAPPVGGPPGQGECEHGNSEKPCKDDPQPDKGKDCEEHGPKEGGVNEDHCKGTTPPPPCTINCGPVDPPPCTINCNPVDPPVDPPKEDPPSTPTTPETPETPPVTPEAPASPESPSPSAPEAPAAPSVEEPTFQEELEEQATKQAKENGSLSPSGGSGVQTPATELPYTGLPLGLVALLGAALTGTGAWLRRRR